VPPPVSSAPVAQNAIEGAAIAGCYRQASTFKDARAEFEREFIKQKLKDNGGNVSKTADAIGVERSNLHRKIKSLGIAFEDK
jgi:two-component system nitrogen regulation response regulator NtrX